MKRLSSVKKGEHEEFSIQISDKSIVLNNYISPKKDAVLTFFKISKPRAIAMAEEILRVYKEKELK